MKKQLFLFLFAIVASVGTMFAEQITVAQALQIAGQLEQGATTAEEYEVVGYVTAYEGADADGGWAKYNNQRFWIADEKGTAASNADGALEVYQGVPSEMVYVGDKVSVKATLTNYNGLLETTKRGVVTILEKVERPAFSGKCKIGDLYYNLDATNKTAEVTYGEYSGLTTANIPASVTYSGTTYSVTSIGDDAFTYCSGLTYVTIGNSVTSIGSRAFYGCSSLTSVTIPNSVTSIESEAFSYCLGLTSVTIPNSVTSIGYDAFYGCSSLTSVTCKANTPPVIGDDVFADSSCEIFVPYSALDAYKNTWSEYAYRISREKVLIGDLYYYLEALDHTAIVTYYGKYYGGFDGGEFKILSYDIDSVVIPQTVTYQMEEYAVVRIGDDAFRAYDYDRGEGAGNNVRSITLHSGITSIAPSAFCKDEDRYHSSVILSSIYVPCGELERFQQMVSDDRLKYIPSSYHITINKSANGYVSVPNFTSCDKEVQISANPDYGYHFVKWSDGNTDNPRTIALTQDTTFEATFAHNPVITYTYDSNLGYVDGPTITPTGKAEDDIIFTAQPARGCIFVKWGDGNTDNPRTYHLSQDVTMEAIFDYALSGNCGKDNVLTWKLDKSAMALEISGAGALADNFNYTYDIVSATIGNEVTVIGQSAFAYCRKLKNVIVGSNVKVIEEYAFDDCTAIETITCYSMRPPTVNNGAFENLDYSTIIYVPADYLNTYKMHDFWGIYDVRPIGASQTETTEVKVEPTATTADVVWPAVENAATYELVIKDKNGNVVCTLIFNANGQLTQIDFGAPARDNTAQAAGFAFTVTGLEEGTSYDLTITAKDGNGTTLDEKTIAFSTSGWTGVDALQAGELRSSKVLRNGEVLILRGGKMYNLQGVEVK